MGGGGTGGWVGDFEIEFPVNACRMKKIACSTNGIKKFLHCCKKKMLQGYFIVQIALQNPSEPATILHLLPFKLCMDLVMLQNYFFI